MRRGKIIREIEVSRPFRMAEIDIIDDVYPPSGAESRTRLKKNLLDAFGEIIPVSGNVQQNLHELMAGQMALGPITDIISYTLPFEVEEKLSLLAEPNVDQRANELVRLLKTGKIQLHSVTVEEQLNEPSSPAPRFPPPFSEN